MAVPETMIEGFAFERSLMKQDIPYEPVSERRILLQPSPYKESSGSKLKKRLLSKKKSGKMKATKHIKVTGRAKRRNLLKEEPEERKLDEKHFTLSRSPEPFTFKRNLVASLGPHYQEAVNQRGLFS